MNAHKSRIGFCPKCRRNAVAKRFHGHTPKRECQVCGTPLEELSEERQKWKDRADKHEELARKRGQQCECPKKWLDKTDELDKICSIRNVQQLLDATDGPEPSAGERDDFG